MVGASKTLSSVVPISTRFHIAIKSAAREYAQGPDSHHTALREEYDVTSTCIDNTAIAHSAPDAPSISTDRVIIGEHSFKRLIALERKRTERSHVAFALMLIQTGGNSNSQDSANMEAVLTALQASIRETDVVGWYEGHATGAALFTELIGEKSAILNSIFARVNAIVQNEIPGEYLDRISISFHFFPENWQGDDVESFGNRALYPDLAIPATGERRGLRVKRILDVAGASLALLVCAPVMAAVALSVKLSSRGPVLLKQSRVGQYGRKFTFLKFRSMYVNNDPTVHREYVKRLITGDAPQAIPDGRGGSVYKLANDSRVTRVGKFLRRTSLDELPQLFNVLKGDMSLVGPRPPLPYEVSAYQIWHRRRVLHAKPGITGLWQVKGRSRVKFDDMVRLDLDYASRRSFWLDVKILLCTPGALLRGAY